MKLNWTKKVKDNKFVSLKWKGEGKRPLLAAIRPNMRVGSSPDLTYHWEVDWEYEDEHTLELWVRGNCPSVAEAVSRAEEMVESVLATGLRPGDINPEHDNEAEQEIDRFLFKRLEEDVN